MDTSSPFAASTIDPKLLTRVAKGDQQAFSQLYDQSSTVLFSLALRILGNREEAAEVLQEVYLDIWRKVVRYDVGRGTPIAWLLTLTRGRAIDRLRTRGPRAGRQTDASVDVTQAGRVSDRDSGPFESQADQELRTVICGALANLEQAQQQEIELAYYEGLTHMEIATRLNQPLDEVKTGLRVGMSNLRDSLQPYWEQDEAV